MEIVRESMAKYDTKKRQSIDKFRKRELVMLNRKNIRLK